MSSNIPAVEDATVWGLIGLKKGQKKKQQKLLGSLRKENKPLDAVDEIGDSLKTRRLAFGGVKRQLTLWKGPVMKNRLADQLIFPLNDNSITIAGSEDARRLQTDVHIAEFRRQTDDLQGKLYASLYKSEKPKNNDYSVSKIADRQIRKKLLEQIGIRERERFLQARLAAKNKRQNKIKSRNFHRHQKGRLFKEFEAEMEQLRENDPKAFAERILKAEVNRAKERASLRHRGGSKFAKLQKLRAKYDEEAREAVANMHERSKDLSKRPNEPDSSGSDDSDIDVTSESDTDGSEFNLESSDDSESEHRSEAVDSECCQAVRWWQKSVDAKGNQSADADQKVTAKTTQPTVISTLVAESILDKCEQNKTIELRATSDSLQATEPEADIFDPDSSAFYRTLEETCAADAALEDHFTKEKSEAVAEETLQDIDTFLPGWNAWTGPGLEAKDEERRKKRIIPAPNVPRDDTQKPHVFIKRRVNNDFKQHLVKSIPFPHNTPEQFEYSISQPISREWVTASTHREMTRPKITVQTGRIIRPISKSAALLRDKDVERLRKQKKNVD